MDYCPRCEFKLEPYARFCAYCGLQLPRQAAPLPPGMRRSRAVVAVPPEASVQSAPQAVPPHESVPAVTAASMPQLSAQQQEVINWARRLQVGQLLTVEACAGSGKTTNLIGLTRSCPDQSFLYLAFNRAVVESARRKFPPNVQIMTVHSLAWHAQFANRNAPIIKSRLSFVDLRAHFPNLNRMALFTLCNLYSDFLQSAEKECTLSPHPGLNAYVNRIFELVNVGQLPMTHDHYLKQFQLREDYPLRYDYVLLDEAQDSNPVTLSIFNRCQARKILVGDPHQSIYAFRGAVNALYLLQPDVRLPLSVCFRSNQAILDKANFFLHRYASDRERCLPMVAELSRRTLSKGSAILSRTNSSLISEIAKFFRQGKLRELRLLRPAELIFAPALAVQHTLQQRYQSLGAEFYFLREFKDAEEIQLYAEKSGDLEILTALNISRKHGDDLDKLYEACRGLEENDRATITLSTAHSCKGLEWESVRLLDDFPDLEEIARSSEYGIYEKPQAAPEPPAVPESAESTSSSASAASGVNSAALSSKKLSAQADSTPPKGRRKKRKKAGKNTRLQPQSRQPQSAAQNATPPESSKIQRDYTPEEFQQEVNLYYMAVTRAQVKLDDHSPNERFYRQSGKAG
ncbi:MAG: UvrD-helicase domain-containing protein [Succinivibrio sp.]|nr:UvrD-helicase domain-containing protein [Succinivibrio sp.]